MGKNKTKVDKMGKTGKTIGEKYAVWGIK